MNFRNNLLDHHRGEIKAGQYNLNWDWSLGGKPTEPISFDDIAIYYFNNEKGAAEITKLDIDEYGRVSGGLPGFFEQNIRNVIEYLDALDTNSN